MIKYIENITQKIPVHFEDEEIYSVFYLKRICYHGTNTIIA
jgi:hypothetical protein